MTNDRREISSLEDELQELREALEQADDGNKATRLRVMIASRESQIADMRKR